MEFDTLKRNIDAVQNAIRRASHGAHVALVAATKTVPTDIIDYALSCGITDIGENRVQEYLKKRDAVRPQKWHFIGTLQKNKAKYLVGQVGLIQSVNSCALADEISRLAQARKVTQDVLIEVNVCGEAAKTGADMAEAEQLFEYVSHSKAVNVVGLMAVPPVAASDEVYKKLRNLFESLHKKDDGFNILSVGMSGDYERAIAYGSNMVRIGSAIFGART